MSILGETPALAEEVELEVLLRPSVGLLVRSLSRDLSRAELEVGVIDLSCFSGTEVELVEVEVGFEEEEEGAAEIGTSIPINLGVRPSESPVYFRKTLTSEVRKSVCSRPCSVCHR